MVNGPDIITADDTNFELQVLEFSEILPVLVDFWAKWSLDCQPVSNTLESLAVQYAGRFRLAQVDVESSPRLTKGYQVHTVPTIKTFENRIVTGQLEGKHTEQQIEDYLKRFVPGPESLLLEKAASYLKDKQYSAVEDTCLEILEDVPGNPPAKLLLAKSLLWQGEYLETLTILHHFPPSREFQAAEKLAPLAEQLQALPSLQSIGKPLDAVYIRALGLIEKDQIPAALDGLLEILKRDKTYRAGNPHKAILGIFELLGEEHPLTREYRPLLANALF
jgi:putative thioredoxin